MPNVQRINTQHELVMLAHQLHVRHNWHEPDEQGVTAKVFGSGFDNAGFWGQDEVEFRATDPMMKKIDWTPDSLEMWVTLYKDGEPVAEINLATLFAFATGYED